MSLPEEIIALTTTAAQAAADKLGADIVAFDVSEKLSITDVFLIVTANNERQVSAVVDGIEEALLKQKIKPTRREGGRESRWVLLDYLSLVVHVQHREERSLYALEQLWKDAPRVPLDIDTRVSAQSESDSV